MQLAIEDEHVDFVGHVYSQQTLHRAWYGKLPWRQASNLSRFLHFILQIILAPIVAATVTIRESVQSTGIKAGNVCANLAYSAYLNNLRQRRSCRKMFLTILERLPQ